MTVLRREATLSESASLGGEAALSQSCVACPLDRACLNPPTATSQLMRLELWVVLRDRALQARSLRRAAQTKPLSSRATATTTFGLGLPRSTMRLKRRCKRYLRDRCLEVSLEGRQRDVHDGGVDEGQA